MENFVYLIGSKSKKEAAVVDAAWDVSAILEAAKEDGMAVKHALVTHYHFDHTNGLADLLKKLDIPVYINKEEAPWMKGLAKANVQAVSSGDPIQIGDVKISFLHTPGHTPGSQCFCVDENLVSGDTLFINACGRTDLPGGNPEEMYKSLAMLAKLPDSVRLYPGHNYGDKPSALMQEQKKDNPFLQYTSLDHFLRAFAR